LRITSRITHFDVLHFGSGVMLQFCFSRILMVSWLSVGAQVTDDILDVEHAVSARPHASWLTVFAAVTEDESIPDPQDPEIQPAAYAAPVDAGLAVCDDVATASDDDCGLVVRYGAVQPRRKGGRPRISRSFEVAGNEAALALVQTAVACARAPRRAAAQLQVHVSNDSLATLVRQSDRGYASLHPLQNALSQLSHFCKANVSEVAPQIDKLVKWKVVRGAAPHRCVSLTALSDILHIPSDDIKTMTQRVACIQHWLARDGRSKFERAVATICNRASLISYLDIGRDDETPMPLRFVCQSQAPLKANAASPPSSDAIMDGRAPAILIMAGLLRKSATTTEAKLLQLEQRWSMLLKVRTTMIHFRGKSVCALRAVENTQGVTIAEARMQASQVTIHANAFQRKTRLTCTDRASSNYCAERRVLHARGEKWLGAHRDCQVHIKATLHNISLGKLEVKEDVTGMLRIALSTMKSSAFIVFQRCAREAVADKILPLRGMPPIETARHRRRVILTFCSGTGCKQAVVATLLAVLPNGNWRKPSRCTSTC
jgi:hypothetical protein